MDHEPMYQVGTKRKRRRFVIRKQIGNTTIYLQTISWEEEYTHIFVASFEDHYQWNAIRFIN